MKPMWLWVLLVGSLGTTGLEANGRGGHDGGRGVASFGHPGATVRPGINGHGIRGQRGYGVGFGRRNHGIRYLWPLFGSGLGTYYSEYNATFWSQDYDASPDLQNPDSPSIFYYQKPANQDVMKNCKDSWATKDTSSSLGNFMNRVFELQCENRHPDVEAKPSEPAIPEQN